MQNDLFFILAAVAFYLWLLRSVLYWVNIWQRSAYQPKLSALAGKARKKVWQYVLSPTSVLTIVGIGVVLILNVTDAPLVYSQLIVLGIVFLKAGVALSDILRNRLTKPSLSFHSLSVIFIAFLLGILLFLFPLTERFLWLLLLDRSIFFVVAFVIAISTFPNELYDDYQIRSAIKQVKEANTRSIMLIGGEETRGASHVLGQLLSSKFNPLVILSSPISAAEVALCIQKEMNAETDVIITAIDTFSEDVICRIAAIIPPTSIVLTCPYNAEDEGLVSMLQELLQAKGKLILDTSWGKVEVSQRQKKLFFFKMSPNEASTKPAIFATQVSQDKFYLHFQAVLPTQTIPLKLPFIGTDNVSYLLPLVFLADQLAIPAKKLQQQAMVLRPLSHVLTYHKSRGGITFVDDTASFNAKTLVSGLSYAKLFPKTRYLILDLSDPLLTRKEIINLGKQIGQVFSVVLLLQPRWQKVLRMGIKESGKTCRVVSISEHEVVSYIRKHAGKGDIVFFEGEQAREAAETLITTSLTSL